MIPKATRYDGAVMRAGRGAFAPDLALLQVLRSSARTCARCLATLHRHDQAKTIPERGLSHLIEGHLVSVWLPWLEEKRT